MASCNGFRAGTYRKTFLGPIAHDKLLGNGHVFDCSLWRYLWCSTVISPLQHFHPLLCKFSLRILPQQHSDHSQGDQEAIAQNLGAVQSLPEVQSVGAFKQEGSVQTGAAH